MLGELFAAQVRKSLEAQSQNDLKEFGRLLREKVFQPGDSLPWQDFVKEATGEPLSVNAFISELEEADSSLR